MIIVYRILLFIIGAALGLLFLCGCSCERLAKRVERKCGKNAFTDTLVVWDTVITKSNQKDTVFKFMAGRDTVIVREGRMTYKYYYNQHDSTVFLDGNCVGDTIYVEKKVPYTKIINQYSWFEENKWYFLICAVALIALIFGLFMLLPKKSV